MDSKNIIRQEKGELYLKLREEFNLNTMQIHCTMAHICRTVITVVKADSKGEVSSTQCHLSAQEFGILSEGYQAVQHFWNEAPIPEGYVLLECGCIVRWEHPDKLPMFRDWYYCGDHEDARIYRFTAADFIGGDIE